MSPSEYSELTKSKEFAASLHRMRKLRLRERIADAIQANPEWAYARAQEALNKEPAVWQQWSTEESEELTITNLRRWSLQMMRMMPLILP